MGRAVSSSPAGVGFAGRACLLLLLSLAAIPSRPARAQGVPPALPDTVPVGEEPPEELPPPRGAGREEETTPPPDAVAPEAGEPPAPRPNGPHPGGEAAPPVASLALESAVPHDLADACARGKGKIWEEGVHFECLPTSLLWRVPWANQREPRMFGKFNNAPQQGQTTSDQKDDSTIDTAIGAEFGLTRLQPCNPCEGFQFDVFAVVFTRFDGSRLIAADYRAGVPLTFAKGPWQAKVSYEHTSAHLGDEFIDANPGVVLPRFTRDEFVFAAGYFITDDLRAYGQLGVSFGKRRPPGGLARYDVGLEWTHPLGGRALGQPFAAVDLDFRPEQDYDVNVSAQAGWLWQNPDSRHAVRVALEYYNGSSPYGAFFQQQEDFVGLAIQYDW
jgi:hypothetical protein